MEKQLLRSHDGFSFAESLLVLSVVIIIIFIVPITRFDNLQLSEEEINDELISVLNYYQTKAYETGEVIVITFPPGRDTISIRSKALQIRAQYKIKNGKIYEGNSIQNTEIVFIQHGVRSGGTIKYYVNQTLYQIIIQIHRGRLRVEKV
ncbi:hypothetical protein [Macrococcoides caseolyticum]|uniref:hypothetical protein n=1 Tax=Macrococcoides caseolyticum TaxID=69966 RepID=UPI001F3EEF9E|nr:hypothetical protein [Macrococcus caseolyticus]MCE4956107.1 hypothetical protein [Macrococcus caseolyticus]